MGPSDYGWEGSVYRGSGHIGWTTLEVLPQLKGLPWNELALAYVHALRPSMLRVSTGQLHAMAVPWRVTVMIDGNGIIQEIWQEVEVALPVHVRHGLDLSTRLKQAQEQRDGA